MLTCSVSSQHSLGLRQVAKKSCDARVSRNSTRDHHKRYRVLAEAPSLPPALPPLTWQVPPCLSHAPHRGVLRLLPAGRAQERVVLQLGEAFGAAEQRAGTGHHPRGVCVASQAPTTGAEGARVSSSSPLPDRRRGLGAAVTNVINSPHHSPGLLPAEDRGPSPGQEAMRCSGRARLSYRSHQLLPPGAIWGERGAGRAVLHSPRSVPGHACPASPLWSCWGTACAGEGNRGTYGNKVPKTSAWEQ